MFVGFVTLCYDCSALWRFDLIVGLYLVLSVFTSRSTCLLAAVRVSVLLFSLPDLNLSELTPFAVKETKIFFFFKLCILTLIQGIKIPQLPSLATAFNNPKAFTFILFLSEETFQNDVSSPTRIIFTRSSTVFYYLRLFLHSNRNKRTSRR
jgi:hypothetical protein